MESEVPRLRTSLIEAEGKATRMRASLTQVEEEATMLRKSLFEAKKRASLAKRRALEAAKEAIEAFWKGEDFHQRLLESCQDAYAQGIWWCKRKVVKHFPKLDLDVLSSKISSFDSESGSSNIDEGGEAILPTF